MRDGDTGLLAAPGDPAALAAALRREDGSGAAGALETVRERCAPEAVADRLRAVYAGA